MAELLGITVTCTYLLFLAMPVSVAQMLRWGLPPCMILCVVLLKLSGTIPNEPIDFAEYFAGCGALSRGLREETPLRLRNCFFSVYPCCVDRYMFVVWQYLEIEAGFRGISLDIDYDSRTQDMTSDSGFLHPGLYS